MFSLYTYDVFENGPQKTVRLISYVRACFQPTYCYTLLSTQFPEK